MTNISINLCLLYIKGIWGEWKEDRVNLPRGDIIQKNFIPELNWNDKSQNSDGPTLSGFYENWKILWNLLPPTQWSLLPKSKHELKLKRKLQKLNCALKLSIFLEKWDTKKVFYGNFFFFTSPPPGPLPHLFKEDASCRVRIILEGLELESLHGNG